MIDEFGDQVDPDALHAMAEATVHISLSSELKFTPGEKLKGEALTKTLEQVARRSGDVLGGPEHAKTWLEHHPVPALGGQTSAKLIAEGWGEAVLNYIDEIRYGSRG